MLFHLLKLQHRGESGAGRGRISMGGGCERQAQRQGQQARKDTRQPAQGRQATDTMKQRGSDGTRAHSVSSEDGPR